MEYTLTRGALVKLRENLLKFEMGKDEEVEKIAQLFINYPSMVGLIKKSGNICNQIEKFVFRETYNHGYGAFGESECDVRFLIRCKNGDKKDWDFNKYAIIDEGGEVLGTVNDLELTELVEEVIEVYKKLQEKEQQEFENKLK